MIDQMFITLGKRFSLWGFGVLLTAVGLPCLSSSNLHANTSSKVTSSAALIATSASFQEQQRSQYIAARAALKKRHMKTYRRLKSSLIDYPLTSYLEYDELTRRLYLLPYEDVDSFLDQQASSYLGDKLLASWLKHLAAKGRWHEYQSYYQPHLKNTELKCYLLGARLRNGEEEALNEVAELWNVGKSQPKACDRVFKAWIKKGYLTPELAWERHRKAVESYHPGLAKYVTRLMRPEHQRLARLMREVHSYPHRIKKHSRFREQSPEMQQVILHGIKRLARRDPLTALYEWERYDAMHLFNESGRQDVQEYLISRLTRKGKLKSAEQVMQQMHSIANRDIVEWLARDSLKRQDWVKVYHWIQMLPTESQRSERWLYWRARTMEELDIADPTYPTPKQIFSALALKRGFYGFLSADILGHEYTLLHKPADPSEELMQGIATHPGIKRAKELFTIGHINSARREWLHTTRQLDTAGIVAAGKLAEQWGWYRKGIQAMIEARYWDDLEVRFPLAYQEYVDGASAETAIEPTLLFAIARQESSFTPDARSPAGAMGLMQLMPATAKMTARRSGLRYRYRDLLKPQKNITLGSRYLHQLLDQFDGNRILAAAAYNAGPHRVKQWLSADSQRLPYDIWIETIPFKETRGYVQNVLAFSVIYGYRLGENAPMITSNEAKRAL